MAEFLVTMQFSMSAGDIAHVEQTANEMRCSIADRVADLITTAIQLESAGEAVSNRALTVERNQLPFDPDPLQVPLSPPVGTNTAMHIPSR